MDELFVKRLKLLIGEQRPYTWASAVGISKGAFSRIYNEGIIPGPDLLRRIKRHSRCTLDWLVDGDGLPPPSARLDKSADIESYLDMIDPPTVAEDRPDYGEPVLSPARVGQIASAIEVAATRAGVTLSTATIAEFAASLAQQFEDANDWTQIDDRIKPFVAAHTF